MATLNNNANRVLGEFGQRIPENLLSFEDVRREFLQVRSLELQKQVIADTDKQTTDRIITAGQRDARLPAFEYMVPSFVEFERTNSTSSVNPAPEKVEIVPIEKIASYEGGRAIAFYDNQRRYRASWDFWRYGTIRIWYAPMEDLTTITGSSEVAFVNAFDTYLVKQTALNVIGIVQVNLALQAEGEADITRLTLLRDALSSLAGSLVVQVERWRREYKRYVNKDLNTQPHLRRTGGENTFDNVTGNFAGDFTE